MRVAMFTDTYTPQINGVVTSIQAFRTELERQGHEVHVFAPAGHAPCEERVHRLRSFTFAPYPEYKISVPHPRLVDEFERIRADVIHVHTPISVGLIGIGLARHFDLPAIGTFHTLLPEYMHYLVKGSVPLLAPAQRLAWNWCRWFYNRCDAVIAPSAATAQLLKQKHIKKPIYAIPTGIQKPAIASRYAITTFRKRWGLNGKVLLHVGRVTREKGIEAIIDAVHGLPDATLAIASDGPHRAELQKYVRQSGLAKRVRFLGYLPKPELAAAYSAADLFVCGSQSETQGIVLLEAAAAGTPIVALDAPVVSDFIRENRAGIIATKDDFAHAIESALEDTELRVRMKRRAKSIADKYSIERCTKELIEVYEQAAKRKSRV